MTQDLTPDNVNDLYMTKINLDINDEFSIEKLNEIYFSRIKNKTNQGIDGITTMSFDENIEGITERIHNKIISSKYRFSPYLQILKSKGSGRPPRLISKPTVRDKLTLSLIKEVIHKHCPHSFSRTLPNVHIRNIYEYIKNIDVEDYSFIKIDISGFYDSIDRDILISMLENKFYSAELITLIKRAITNKTVPVNYRKKNSSSFLTTKGVPQGLSISNALASLYMEEFDAHVTKYECFYNRYVDDILIIVKNSDLESIKKKLITELTSLKLDINKEKTEDGKISDEFSYLGYLIKYPLITIRKSTKERFILSIIGIFTEFKHNADYVITRKKLFLTEENVKDTFLLKLNEKITGAINDTKRYGWIFYFLEINDMMLLHEIDNIILNLFKRLDKFDNKAPSGVKKLVKTYYEAKYNLDGGYIHSYDKYQTTKDKIKYLVAFGWIDKEEEENRTYSVDDINRLFETIKQRHLMQLEEDLGNMS